MSTESDSVAPKRARRKGTKHVLTPEEEQKMLSDYHYDPETGIVTWKRRAGTRRKAGDRAESTNAYGYRILNIPGNRHIMVHRFAFFFMTGRWPRDTVDHCDGDPANNRFENLREATCSQNSCNRKTVPHNTSGFKGVTFESKRPELKKRWKAVIVVNGKIHNLGRFYTPQEAHAARQAAAARLHGDFANFV